MRSTCVQQKQTKKQDFEVHDYNRRLEKLWTRIKKDLSKQNIALIQKYDNEMIKESLARPTRIKHLEILLNIGRLLNKPLVLVTKEEIDNLVVEIIKIYSSQNGQETNTTWDHKKVIKIFFRWLKLGSRSFQEVGDPPETKSIKLKQVKDKIVREDLLDDADLSKLLHACGENQRDRAFIDCHYEAGTRPGEILNLKLKHLKFDKYGAILKVDGKTGARTVRLVTSTPNLAKWIDVHPLKDNPEAPLWIKLAKEHYGEPLTYTASLQMLARRCKKANISKHVNLKLFRHSEATKTANFMTESQMKKRHGWSNTSKMPARYTHMINEDVDNAIFKHLGITKEDDKDNRLPKICNICKMINSHDSTICSQCGKPIDLETALKIEEKDKNEISEIKGNMKTIEDEMLRMRIDLASFIQTFRKDSHLPEKTILEKFPTVQNHVRLGKDPETVYVKNHDDTEIIF